MATTATQVFSRKYKSEEERLMKLFWNRAELKKEFGDLRDEKRYLTEQVRQHEATALRLQERFDQLEEMLADPDKAYNAMVFYQLRGIWNDCSRRLRRYADELRASRGDRERRQHLAIFRERQLARVADLQVKLDQLEEKRRGVEADQTILQQRMGSLRGFWNFNRRREIVPDIERTRHALTTLDVQIEQVRSRQQEFNDEEAPPFEGLSVEGRRHVNIHVIALAQELFLHYVDDNVANLSREASIRQALDVSYGSHRDCRDLSRRIGDARRAMESDTELAARVERRQLHLLSRVDYRRDADAVPAAGILADIQVCPDGKPDDGAYSVNVLADEYWDIFSSLCD